MRRTTVAGPRCIDTPAGGARDVSRPTRGNECSTFVDLARRMSIPEDDAIRQFVDFALGTNSASDRERRLD